LNFEDALQHNHYGVAFVTMNTDERDTESVHGYYTNLEGVYELASSGSNELVSVFAVGFLGDLSAKLFLDCSTFLVRLFPGLLWSRKRRGATSTPSASL
jgi:hypothetical protein